MSATFIPYPLKLVKPDFESPLAGLIIDLEYLRKLALTSTTPASLFSELKEFFHLLESVGSARIEGNNTTVAEYLETKIEALPGRPSQTQSLQEILNIEEAMRFVEDWVRDGRPINETFVKSLHALVVEGLDKEGDAYPGAYRPHNVRIANAQHCPPDSSLVPGYMEELMNFLKQADPGRFDLLKVALAHHRFVWIHPFGNGNGRTVRLFTYALLLHYGFGLDQRGGIINPTAVFCSDREDYYELLAGADSGEEGALLRWCEYVLSGLKVEIEKVNRLCDYSYVAEAILKPSIEYALAREHITTSEYQVLSLAIKQKEIQNKDLQALFPGKTTASLSQLLRKLVDSGMLMRTPENARRYVMRFRGTVLMRGVMLALDKAGFLPLKEDLPA